MYRYFLTMSSVNTEDGKEVATYGICGNGIKFEDVATNETAVANLVHKNELGRRRRALSGSILSREPRRGTRLS